MKKILIVGLLLICFVFTCGVFVLPASAFSYTEGDSAYSLRPYVDYSISYIGKSYFGGEDGESIRFPQMTLGAIPVFDNEYNTIRYSSFENAIGALPVTLEGFRQIVEVEQMEGVLFRGVDALDYGLTFYDVSSFDDFTQLHTVSGEDIYISGFNFSMNDFVVYLPDVMTGDESGHNFDMFFLPTFIYNWGSLSSFTSELSFDLFVYEVESEYNPSQVEWSNINPVYYNCSVSSNEIDSGNGVIAFEDVNVTARNEFGYIINLYEKYHNENVYAQITNLNYSFQFHLGENDDSIGYFNDLTYNVNYCDNFTYNSLITPTLDDLDGETLINGIPEAPEGQLGYTPNLTLALFNDITDLNYSWYWEAERWYGRYQELAGGGIGNIASSFVGSIANTVSQFFDIDVFGVGLTLGHILGVVLTILIVIVFLKLFAGG